MGNINEKKPAPGFLQDGKFIDLITITVIWGVAVYLVNPSGDFPLNDDWSYGIAVKNILQEGSYEPTRWTSMTLVSQVIWGAVFCSIFGFSFEVLRFSTLVLALLGVISLYLLIRQLNQVRWFALLSAFTVAFNLIYFPLSLTFMTDVPFTAFATMALLFLGRSLTSDSTMDLAFGSFLTTVAILCRQTGLFIPLAFGLTFIYTYGFRKRVFIKAFFPLILGLSALFIFEYWLKETGKMPELYGQQVEELLLVLRQPFQMIKHIIFNTTVTILYLGFFLTPILLLLLLSKAETEQAAWAKKWTLRGLIPLSILIGIRLIDKNFLMPFGYNIIHKAGLGPFSLYDIYMLELPNIQNLPEELWLGITIIAVLGGAALIIYLLAAVRAVGLNFFQNRSNPKSSLTIFFLLGAVIYFLPLLLVPYYYDRYMLMLLVLVVLILISFTKRVNFTNSKPLITGSILVAFFAIFSIALTHDFLSWNRARWKALEHISQNKNISYSQIHGGFEFNGLKLFSDKSMETNTSGSWWSEKADDYTYMVTFGEVPNFEVIGVYEFTRWIPPFHDEVFLLRRQNFVSPD